VSVAPSAPGTADLRTLRRTLRARRRALGEEEAVRRARALASAIARLPEFRAAATVAGYLAADGEIDPARTLALARRMGKQTVLPVLRGSALVFAVHGPGVALEPNRFGIAEPVGTARCHPRAIDLVLVPLVGFDATGNRLGMGGGFYDRTFAYLRARRCWRRPHLVGIAHPEQRVDALAARPWDVPLTAVVTPAGVVRVRAGARHVDGHEHARGIGP